MSSAGVAYLITSDMRMHVCINMRVCVASGRLLESDCHSSCANGWPATYIHTCIHTNVYVFEKFKLGIQYYGDIFVYKCTSVSTFFFAVSHSMHSCCTSNKQQ